MSLPSGRDQYSQSVVSGLSDSSIFIAEHEDDIGFDQCDSDMINQTMYDADEGMNMIFNYEGSVRRDSHGI